MNHDANIYGLTYTQLEDFLIAAGEKKTKAPRITNDQMKEIVENLYFS